MILLASVGLCAGPTSLLGLCWTFWTFLVAFGAFGVLTGSLFLLPNIISETSDNPTVPGVLVGCTNPVLLNMLSLSCLSEAFAFISALRGVAAMAGPPAAGLVVEWTGDPEVM